MKYRYYITDISDGDIKGTNDTKLAEDLADLPIIFIFDSLMNRWLTHDGNKICREKIEEYGQYR